MKKKIDYRGTRLYYDDAGNGMPVILLHGFGESATIWDEQVKFLTEYFRIITPDLPGSGSSPMPEMGDGFFTMDEYAEAILKIIDEEGITQCALIGHSMGGYITLAFAEKYPERLLGFGLFHSAAMADNEEKIKTRQKGISFVQSHGAAAFLEEVIPNLYGAVYKAADPAGLAKHVEESKAFSASALISYYRAMMQRPDRKAVLENFPKPVLFIMGEEDKTVNLQESLSQSHLPRESHVHIWKAVAHMGMRENSQLTNNTLFNFIKHIFNF